MQNQGESTHELNGQPVKPKRKPRPKKGAKTGSKPTVDDVANVQPEEKCGRSASTVRQDSVTYLVKPWIPNGCLTLVAGQPQCGKSSFSAWLIAQAGRAAMLPGYEESVGSSTIPRLLANGVKLSDVLILDDKEYRLPKDKQRLLKALEKWGAKLLVLDPIDSYMEDGKSENHGPDVREMLEAAHWIGEKAGIAVVGVRHPGKDVKNIMPGSRAWRAVPRSVVYLTVDTTFMPKRHIIHDKDSHGNDVPPHKYMLEGKPGQPRKFKMGGDVEAGAVQLSRHVSDPTEKQEVRLAGRILRRLMTKETEPTVEDFKNECLRNGVADRSRKEAARLLGMDPKPKEGGGKWYLFREGKDWPSWTDDVVK